MVVNSLCTCSLVPRPHPLALRGEGSGDIGAISWSCTPSRDSIKLNVLSHMNAELAQPRNRSNVTRPFSSQRVGSGDETSVRVRTHVQESIYGTGSSNAHAYYVTKWRTTYTQYKSTR